MVPSTFDMGYCSRIYRDFHIRIRRIAVRSHIVSRTFALASFDCSNPLRQMSVETNVENVEKVQAKEPKHLAPYGIFI